MKCTVFTCFQWADSQIAELQDTTRYSRGTFDVLLKDFSVGRWLDWLDAFCLDDLDLNT